MSDLDNVLEPGEVIKPPVGCELARDILDRLYGFSGELHELNSFDDRNFHVRLPDGEEYVLKVSILNFLTH